MDLGQFRIVSVPCADVVYIYSMEDRVTKTEHLVAAEDWISELQLADGPVVRFRHVRPEDEPLVTEAIRTSSRETLLHRFFSPIRKVSPDLLRKLLTIDRSQGACFVGVISENGKERIICGARYVRLEKPGSAEIAITVHDDFQRRGLGSYLLKMLVELARADGIRCFEADVMTSNSGMLKLLHKLHPTPSGWHRAGDVYHVTIKMD
ncbi:MAG: GNAT family N-acetyltransferase [Verrucomicrobia bacterium]|nr:GNAT family N-acetyltransferase [Verrucomicrobiota bacterium]